MISLDPTPTPSGGPVPARTETATHDGVDSRGPVPAADPAIADFVVERVLGRGGFGVVSLVRSRLTGRVHAMKRVALTDARTRRAIFEELLVWIGLPAHPNVSACAFFRVAADAVYLFTEFADAGSLDDVLAAGRGDPEKFTERALDIGIQTARGLALAHAEGLVHLDVKPANVLVFADGRVAVNDFGAAALHRAPRLPLRIAEGRGGEIDGPVRVRAGTRRYMSPEQAAAMGGAQVEITAASDVFSWGVMMLELLLGDGARQGPLAGAELLARLDEAAPPVPAGLRSLLGAALSLDPVARPSMQAIADDLEALFAATVGRDYPRPQPQHSIPKTNRDVRADLVARLNAGVPWRLEAPERLLAEACAATGGSEADAAALVPRHVASRTTEVVADLMTVVEARERFAAAVAGARPELRARLVACLVAEGFILEFLNDLGAALRAYDRAVEEGTDAVDPGSRQQAHLQRGVLRQRLGDDAGAERDFDAGLALLTGPWKRHTALLLNKADALRRRGALEPAIRAYDELLATPGATADEQASAWNNRGLALIALGQPQAAHAAFSRAIEIREGASGPDQRLDRYALAQSYLNRGNLGGDEHDTDRAIELLRLLVEQWGRSECAGSLARALMNRGVIHIKRDESAAALPWLSEGLAIMESRLGDQHDVTEVAQLAKGYGILAAAQLGVGRTGDVLRAARRTRELLEQAEGAGRPVEDALKLRAESYLFEAAAHHEAGWVMEALKAADRAGTLAAEGIEAGRTDLMHVIANARAIFAAFGMLPQSEAPAAEAPAEEPARGRQPMVIEGVAGGADGYTIVHAGTRRRAADFFEAYTVMTDAGPRISGLEFRQISDDEGSKWASQLEWQVLMPGFKFPITGLERAQERLRVGRERANTLQQRTARVAGLAIVVLLGCAGAAFIPVLGARTWAGELDSPFVLVAGPLVLAAVVAVLFGRTRLGRGVGAVIAASALASLGLCASLASAADGSVLGIRGYLLAAAGIYVFVIGMIGVVRPDPPLPRVAE